MGHQGTKYGSVTRSDPEVDMDLKNGVRGGPRSTRDETSQRMTHPARKQGRQGGLRKAVIPILSAVSSLRTGLVCVAVLLGSVCVASPAHASPSGLPTDAVRVVDQGRTTDGGWIAFTGLGTSGSTKQLKGYTVTSAGGGVWDFGSYLTAFGQKVCYSNYYHPSLWHGSTAIMSGQPSRSDVPARITSHAQVARYTFDTCYVYWRR